MIRPASAQDLFQICDIYNYYVRNTVITFEEEEVSPQEMEQRFIRTTRDFPWLVCEEEGSILGYAYAGRWKERSAYRFCAESTVYVRRGASGRGAGSTLYALLLEELRRKGMHVVIGVLALPNEASQALHEKFGFRKAAHFHEVGKKFDRWIDVGYWELLLQ